MGRTLLDEVGAGVLILDGPEVVHDRGHEEEEADLHGKVSGRRRPVPAALCQAQPRRAQRTSRGLVPLALVAAMPTRWRAPGTGTVFLWVAASQLTWPHVPIP